MSELNQSKIEQATSETRVLEVLIEARKPLIDINMSWIPVENQRISSQPHHQIV